MTQQQHGNAPKTANQKPSKKKGKNSQNRKNQTHQRQAPHYVNVRQQFSAFNTQGAVLARQMAIPEAAGSLMRMPTVDMPRTSVVKITSTNATTTEPWVPSPAHRVLSETSGDLLFIIYGMPGLAYMYGPHAATQAIDATTQNFLYANTLGVGTDEKMVLNDSKIPPGGSLTVPWRPLASTDFTDGTYRTLGLSGGKTCAWFDATEKMQFTFYPAYGSTAATVPGPFSVRIYQWKGPNDPFYLYHTLSYTKAEVGSDKFSWEIPKSGWWSCDFTLGAVDTDTLPMGYAVSVAGVATVENPGRMRFHVQSDLATMQLSDSIRRTGFSVLISNTTAEINKQGTIVAARLVHDAPYGELQQFTTEHLAEAADKYTGPASNGLYTYMDFDQSAERFTQSWSGVASMRAGPVIDLDYNGYVHYARITNPAPQTSPNTFLVTCNAIYEFRSDSQLFQKSVPFHSHDALVEARRVNNATPFFYENPIHLGDIWNGIRSAFNSMRRAAVPLGAVASTFFPEASPAIMGVAKALQR